MDLRFWKKGKEEPTGSPEPDENGIKTTILGKNLNIKARITGDDPVRMMCAFQGDVDLRNEIEIGPQANITGNINAEKITVTGKVNGNLSAEHRLAISRSAVIRGNLKASSLVMDKGSNFNGKIDMTGRDDKRK